VTARIRVAGVEHVLTPTAVKALRTLLRHERNPEFVAVPDVHPAARFRLVGQGLIELDRHGTPRFTPTGREVAERLEGQ
jgi:hypothetical protein